MNQSVGQSVNTDGNNESVDSNGDTENCKKWMNVKFRGRTRETWERYQGVDASKVLSWAKGRMWVAVVEMGSSIREIS